MLDISARLSGVCCISGQLSLILRRVDRFERGALLGRAGEVLFFLGKISLAIYEEGGKTPPLH